MVGEQHPARRALLPLDAPPSAPDGSPLLHRWFAIAMLILVPLGLGVVVWAFLAAGDTTLSAAERRPVGDASITHDRGSVILADEATRVAAEGCGEGITLEGDPGGLAVARRALAATCQLLQRAEFAQASVGLERWKEAGGVLRVGAFELTGVDSTALLEDGRLVIELNAVFQLVDAVQAAPSLVHELAHLAGSWPGATLSAEAELAAVQLQDVACARLNFRTDPPRACLDADELLADPDPAARLAEAGFPE